MTRTMVDAKAGEYLQATIGTAYKVHPNCGSTEQHVGTMDYDYPDPVRMRFAVCRDHRQAEQVLPVCNPMYQEARSDGVMAHLELDPERGTVLVPDTACKDRVDLDYGTPCIVCGAPVRDGIGHDARCSSNGSA